MSTQALNEVSTPQGVAQITPSQLPKGDVSYFTQSMDNVNASLIEIRLQMQTNEAAILKKVEQSIDTFIKAQLKMDGDSRVMAAQVQGEFKTVDVSIKHLTTAVNEIKPKVDNLTKWGWIVVGGATVLGALIGLAFKSGSLKTLLS